MDAAIETLPVRIDATPYRVALTQMGELIRGSKAAKQVWQDLDRRRLDGACVFVDQVRVEGAVELRPSAEFLMALAKMRKVAGVPA